MAQARAGERPPIGLRPKWIADGDRLTEVREALLRYLEALEPIPPGWIEEYNALTQDEEVIRGANERRVVSGT